MSSRSYDNTQREIKAAQRVLRLNLELSRRGIRTREGRPRSERRREAREALLPADRVCPCCKQMKVRSKQWVVEDGVAVCLTCHREGRKPDE